MNCKKLRIVYAGTPDFSVPALQALLKSEHEVVAVYTQPDRPSGRGRKLKPSPVKEKALEFDIPVYQPDNFKTQVTRDELKALDADIMVVAAYGLILPQSVLDIPGLGCINIHASLLPRWRGAAPIERAIQARDLSTGVTFMQMAKGLDTGDMLFKSNAPIALDTTGEQLRETLSKQGGRYIVEVLEKLCKGELTPEVQDNERACYAHKLDKKEALIDWTLEATLVHKTIAAFNSSLVAYTPYNGNNLRLWESTLVDATEAVGKPGEVVLAKKGALHVACGQGVIALTQLQLPGKKPIDAQAFVNGRELLGVCFGAD